MRLESLSLHSDDKLLEESCRLDSCVFKTTGAKLGSPTGDCDL